MFLERNSSPPLPLNYFPHACVGYAVAHLYTALLFTTFCWSHSPAPEAWRALTWKGPLVFNRMLPRETLSFVPLPGDISAPIQRIPTDDPTLWLFYSFCAVVFFGFRWAGEVAGYSRTGGVWYSPRYWSSRTGVSADCGPVPRRDYSDRRKQRDQSHPVSERRPPAPTTRTVAQPPRTPGASAGAAPAETCGPPQ